MEEKFEVRKSEFSSVLAEYTYESLFNDQTPPRSLHQILLRHPHCYSLDPLLRQLSNHNPPGNWKVIELEFGTQFL